MGVAWVILGVSSAAHIESAPSGCPPIPKNSSVCAEYWEIWRVVNLGMIVVEISMIITDYLARRARPPPALP
jgi:hypothetical protein